MASVNWQQHLANLDANLKRVATDWLRQTVGNTAANNVQLDDEFRQTFLQISQDRIWAVNETVYDWRASRQTCLLDVINRFDFFSVFFGIAWILLIRMSEANHNWTDCILLPLLLLPFLFLLLHIACLQLKELFLVPTLLQPLIKVNWIVIFEHFHIRFCTWISVSVCMCAIKCSSAKCTSAIGYASNSSNDSPSSCPC